MLLVPRQLLRSGMTGNVPYYGGRMSPAQAYAASHPPRPPAPTPSFASPVAAAFPRAPMSGSDSADPGTEPRLKAQHALRFLLDSGVITQQEFQEIQARTNK